MNETIKQRIDTVHRGEVPEGYQRTRAGIMPTDWPTKTLAKDVFKSHTNKKHGGAYEVLSATQDRGIIPRKDVDIDIKYDEENISSYKKVDKGDFVISLRSFQGGIEYSEYEGLVSPAYTVLKATKPIDDSYYRAYFKTANFIKRLNGAVYGIRDGKQIGFEDFGDLAIHYPPLAEQQKIAEILSTCDRVIELKQQLLNEKRKQKQWLMQMLLDPDSGVRLPGFSQEWRTVKLGDICTIKTGKLDASAASEHGKYPFFTCSRDAFWIDTYSFDGDAILIAGNGDVGHTKLYSGKFDTYQRTYVLMNFGDLDYRLIKQCIDYTLLPVVYTELQGGAMPYIKLSTLTQLSFSVPVSAKEREALTKVLLSADNEIDILDQELEAWQQKKKALMQLLLTGLVRVTLNGNAGVAATAPAPTNKSE